MKKFVKPLFYGDASARYLFAVSPTRYVNVHENGFGDQFFSTAFSSEKSANRDAFGTRRMRRAKVIYRVVVKLKQPA